MAKAVIIVWVLFTSLQAQPPQEETIMPGIYIMTTPLKKVPCANEAKMFVNGQKICISKKPIIPAEQLTYATAIQYDPKYEMHYIDIGVSPTGSNTLTQINKSLPDTQFALALEGQVICVFKVNPTITIRSFRIGADLQLKELTAIHDVLKNVKF